MGQFTNDLRVLLSTVGLTINQASYEFTYQPTDENNDPVPGLSRKLTYTYTGTLTFTRKVFVSADVASGAAWDPLEFGVGWTPDGYNPDNNVARDEIHLTNVNATVDSDILECDSTAGLLPEAFNTIPNAWFPDGATVLEVTDATHFRISAPAVDTVEGEQLFMANGTKFLSWPLDPRVFQAPVMVSRLHDGMMFVRPPGVYLGFESGEGGAAERIYGLLEDAGPMTIRDELTYEDPEDGDSYDITYTYDMSMSLLGKFAERARWHWDFSAFQKPGTTSTPSGGDNLLNEFYFGQVMTNSVEVDIDRLKLHDLSAAQDTATITATYV